MSENLTERGDEIIKKYLPSGFSRLLLCVVVCLSLVSGCAAPSVGGSSALTQPGAGFDKIAIVPFENFGKVDPSVRIAQCPISGASFRSCKIPGDPERKLEQCLVDELSSSARYIFLPPCKMSLLYGEVCADMPAGSQVERLQKLGSKVGADGVIVGHLFFYQERKGFDYSAEMPASVAFCVHLIRTEDGLSVWHRVFDKTQSSLTENMLDLIPFLRGGGKWMTAEEFSCQGMRDILRDFPYKKGNDK